MKCPHCLFEIHARVHFMYLGKDSEDDWAILRYLCPNPECDKWIIYLVSGVPKKDIEGKVDRFPYIRKRILVRPKGINRPPLPPEVPKEFAEDYNEACLVLEDSPKASAALSRRCLQHLLREVAKVKPGNLKVEIKEVIGSGELPSYLVKDIDYIRNIGNFAAHPIKSEKTGEIVPVEPGEAEWNIDVLELLFDFYFVQPKKAKGKRTALDKKLNEAGKKPTKKSN